jgi:thiol-disulfide isomerase/thioredoxin
VTIVEEILMAVIPTWATKRAYILVMPLVVACLAGTACSPSQASSTAASAPKVTAAPVPALTGLVTRPQLQAYEGWQPLLAEDYTPSPEAIESLRPRAGTFSILLFVGSWCPDCKREVPRLWKIADQAGLPGSTFEIHGLDRTKTDAEGLTAKWNVHFVPTAIVLRSGRELGRIVERPAVTLENDLLHILAGEVVVTPAPADDDIGTCEVGGSCQVN